MAAQSAYSAASPKTPAAPDMRLEPCGAAETDQSSEPLLPIGSRFGDGGRYIVQEIVAIGGMATVYKASDSRLGMTPCALKALFHAPNSAESENDLRAFRDEARLLAGLRHPGIVAVRDYFEEQTALGAFSFIVQEFVEGQNLYDRHRRFSRAGEDPENVSIAPVPEDQVALYGLALARVLDYLHTQTPAILYRDLKPHNIVRRASDGQLVLLDFGISRRVSSKLMRCYSDDLGTPGYAAPEQYQSFGLLDGRTDLYSLGVVLTELATGYNPRAENAGRMPPRLDSMQTRLSPTFCDLLQKCIEPHPAARYSSAAEFIVGLESWRSTPRALRRFQEPAIAWQTAPGSDDRSHAAQVQFTSLGESSQAFALAAPSGVLQILEAASGQPLATRSSINSTDMSRRIRLFAEPGGTHLARVTEPAPDSHAAAVGVELTIFDSGLKPKWRLQAKQDRLHAAWLTHRAEKDGFQRSRIAVASQKSSGRQAVVACAELSESSGEWHYIWQAALPADPVMIASSGDGGALTIDTSGTLTAYDAFGSKRWNTLPPFLRGVAGPTHLIVPEYCDNLLLVCCGTTLEAINLDCGSPRWRAPWIGFAPGAPQAMLDGTRILLPTRECGLVELDAATGRATPMIEAFPRALAGLTRLLPGTDVFAAAETGLGSRLMLYDAGRGKSIWETQLPGLGAAGAPCVSEEADIVAVRDFSGGITAWRWSGN